MDSNLSRILALTLVTILSSSCVPQVNTQQTLPEDTGQQDTAIVGERVVSVWTYNYYSEITMPPKHEAGYSNEGSHTEDTIQGTFRIIEVERKIYVGTVQEYSVIEYRIEGSASGLSTFQKGARRMVQQGFTQTTTTDCPAISHSHSANYEISGHARNGSVHLHVRTEDYGERSAPEWLVKGTCNVEVWDQVSDERRTGTKDNTLLVHYRTSLLDSFHPDEDWEHSYVSEDGHIRKREWVRPIETMPCVVHLTRNSTLVTCEEPSIIFATLPEGSNHQWSISAGGDRAQIGTIYTYRPLVEVEVTGSSDSANDIVIKGSYVGEDGVSRSCTGFITAITPSQLEVLAEQNLPLQEQGGVWNVGVNRKYRVLDQFGDPVRQEGLEVSERFTGVDWMGNEVSWDAGFRELSYNPNDPGLVGPGAPRLPYAVTSWYTDEEGVFSDKLQIFREEMFPDETNFVLYQEIFVEGCLVRASAIHFLRDSVSVEER